MERQQDPGGHFYVRANTKENISMHRGARPFGLVPPHLQYHGPEAPKSSIFQPLPQRAVNRVPQSRHTLAREFLRASIVLRGLFCSTRIPVFSFKRVGGSASHINRSQQVSKVSRGSSGPKNKHVSKVSRGSARKVDRDESSK